MSGYPGFPPGSTRLTGSAVLSDAPLTVEDWRIVHMAYYGFITIVRKVAKDAYARQQAVAAPGRDGGEGEGDER